MTPLSHAEVRIIEEMIKGYHLNEIPGKVLMSMGKVKKVLFDLKEKTDCRTNEQLMYFIGKNDLLLKNSHSSTKRAV